MNSRTFLRNTHSPDTSRPNGNPTSVTAPFRWLLIGLMAFSTARGEEKPKEESQRALMEKHLFPLLMEADRIDVLSVYPLPKEYMKEKPAQLELNIVFGLQGEDAERKMSDADKKVAALARKAPVFIGYPVLGKVTLSKQEDVTALLGELRKSMLTWDEEPEEADCHDPRHALRIVKGERELQFSICFDCGNTMLKGVPDSAKDAAEGFHHFKREFQAVLEKHFESNGVMFLRAPQQE